MRDLIPFLVLIPILVVFGWLTIRAWKAQRWFLKWPGLVLGGAVELLAAALVVLMVLGGARTNKKYEIPVETVFVPTDADAIRRGEHVAVIHYCQAWHTENLGGRLYFNLPGLLSIPTPNLTSGSGGVGRFYADEDWLRAIRHGIGHDGRALWIMPVEGFSRLSDEDVGALIAYLKSAPPWITNCRTAASSRWGASCWRWAWSRPSPLT